MKKTSLIAITLLASTIATAEPNQYTTSNYLFKHQGNEIEMVLSNNIFVLKGRCDDNVTCGNEWIGEMVHQTVLGSTYYYFYTPWDTCFDNPTPDCKDIQPPRATLKKMEQAGRHPVAKSIIEGISQSVGVSTWQEIASVLKNKDQYTNLKIPDVFIIGQKTDENGTPVPNYICKLTGNGCEQISGFNYVKFGRSLNGQKVNFSLTQNELSKEQFVQIRSETSVFLSRLNYHCEEVYTGASPNMVAQMSCWFRP